MFGERLKSHFGCQIASQSGWQGLAGKNTTKAKNLAAKMGGPRGPGPPQPHFGCQILDFGCQIFDFGGISASQILATTLAGNLAGKMAI